MNVTYTPAGFAAALMRFGSQADQAIERGVMSAAYRGLALMQQRTREAIPASANGEPGAVNSSAYLRSWKVTHLGPMTHELHNDQAYAPVIEWGRRKGRPMPPREAIVRWAQRRLGLSEEDARKAAYPIMLAIKRRGLAPRRVMFDPIAQFKLDTFLVEETTRELMALYARTV